MNSQESRKLTIPDSSGVYTFLDSKGRPLYIGRATSLKDRIKSYFNVDIIETRGPRIVDMVTRAKTVRWEETESVLEAIILKVLVSNNISVYNVDERDDKSNHYVVITDELWPRVFLLRARELDIVRGQSLNKTHIQEQLGYQIREYFGPYPHGNLIREGLKIIRKIFPFKDKKSHDPRHEAFYRALGRSPQGHDSRAHERYMKTIEHIILFFKGKKDIVRRKIEQEMNRAVKVLAFEEAEYYKKMLYALNHINDIALIKNSDKRGLGRTGYRIEAYDIAHLSGVDVVGGYTVSIDGVFESREYRTFKLSKQVNNDIGGLVEIVTRRLTHSEWRYPDLIVVDGNEVHKNHVESVLKIRQIRIPVVAVTKDERHKARDIVGNPDIVKKNKKDIIALNAEAHRFVIDFHRKKRNSHIRKLLS